MDAFGGKETGEGPGRFPRRGAAVWIVAALLITGIIVGGLTLIANLGSGPAQVSFVQPEQQVGTALLVNNPPTQTEPEVPVVPIISVIELEWVEIGTARNGDEVLALPIPWDRINAYRLPPRWDDATNQWSKEPAELGLPGYAGSCGAQGDGTALAGSCTNGDVTIHLLSPDEGEHWYELATLAPKTGGVYGTYREGDKIVLYAVGDSPLQTAQDPFLFSYWKAEILLSEIEGLRP